VDDLRIDELDPADDSALRAWWEVGAASVDADRPYDAWPTWQASRANLGRPRSDVARTLLVARAGTAVVGSGLLVRFLEDNRHLAELEVHVHPDHRRRGHGRALLAALEERAAADRRTTLVGTAYAPPEGESASSAFATAGGYELASLEESKLLDLGTAPAAWPALEADVAAHRGAHRVELFEERVPQRWVDDFCDLLSAFMAMVPRGDLDVEAARWTPARLHETEERIVAMGRAWLVAVAVAPDGRLGGFHELSIGVDDPRTAEVGGTLVLPEHRGHRLGLAMKLATHRRLLELFPACRSVVTTNAGVNAPMNAVNEALGYRAVERCLDVQKRVGGPQSLRSRT
jgi:GNAT superfamily N-acetyltransferase